MTKLDERMNGYEISYFFLLLRSYVDVAVDNDDDRDDVDVNDTDEPMYENKNLTP